MLVASRASHTSGFQLLSHASRSHDNRRPKLRSILPRTGHTKFRKEVDGRSTRPQDFLDTACRHLQRFATHITEIPQGQARLNLTDQLEDGYHGTVYSAIRIKGKFIDPSAAGVVDGFSDQPPCLNDSLLIVTVQRTFRPRNDKHISSGLQEYVLSTRRRHDEFAQNWIATCTLHRFSIMTHASYKQERRGRYHLR